MKKASIEYENIRKFYKKKFTPAKPVSIYAGGVDRYGNEKRYVEDAAIHGWDKNHNSYTKKFEEAFATYVGAKYARTLSGGTQALTLALATLDIGPGDEVILPDVTYFACSDVINLLGATPVFVDVDKTWCLDPEAFKKAITKRTKAVMPVWLYGNAPEMSEIVKIAKEHDLFIVEDACPAVGSFYKNKHAGTFGDFGCFSFHGAKIMTTGFGGMLVTDNKKLFEKMNWLADHGEDKSLPYRFFQSGIGYSFDLHNINAAFGLAQLERIEEFVAKKRQIFDWYKERLPSLEMNYEQPYARTNRWMTTIIVEDRDSVMRTLKNEGIDTRPFFFPISTFPMYREAKTPNAHRVGFNGINLPSGIQRTEKEIEKICKLL